METRLLRHKVGLRHEARLRRALAFAGIVGPINIGEIDGYGKIRRRPPALENLLRFKQDARRQFARITLQALQGFKYFAHGFWLRSCKDPILSAQRNLDGVLLGASSSSSERNERGVMGLFRSGGGSWREAPPLRFARGRLAPLRGVSSESLGS